VDNSPYVGIGLLTDTNIRMLGTSLRRVFPIPDDHKFDDLIRALDETIARQ